MSNGIMGNLRGILSRLQKRSTTSLGDILRRRQQQTFVGRGQELAFFSRNLRMAPDARQRKFIIDVHGPGGIGKTELLHRFQQASRQFGALTALTDEREEDVVAAMARIAEQFEAQKQPLRTFSPRHRVYRQRRQELEDDPEAPQGFPAFLGRTVAKGGLHLARQVPVGGVVAEFVDEDTFATLVGDFSSFVARKIGNRDEVQLVLEPVPVLTPLFLADLQEAARTQHIVLFFDTYEQTSSHLDPWLRNLLESRYGDVPPNILLVIAGRHELDRNLWIPYEGLMARLALEPFTRAEIAEYLTSEGVEDSRIVEVIHHLSQGLPLLVATLAGSSPGTAEQVGDSTGEAVDRFLQWIENPVQREVALNAALPRLLNRDVLAVLLNGQEASDVFAWLRKLPFVEQQADGWTYHDVVRVQMLRYKHRESPQSWNIYHRRLNDHYKTVQESLELEPRVARKDKAWQRAALERLYHELCRIPQAYLPTAIDAFLNALEVEAGFARRWAETMEQAGRDAEAEEVQRWGERLTGGLRALDEMDYEPAAEMFEALRTYARTDVRWLPLILGHEGIIYREMARYEEALVDFERALELEPNNAWTLAQVGETYRQMGRAEEALTSLDQTLERVSHYTWAMALRGETYRGIGQYEDALTEFERAIDLDPHYAWAIVLRAETYRQMERYEEALADLNRVLELEPRYFWPAVLRGEVYWQLGQHEKALRSLDLAVGLEPENAWVVTYRGEICRRLERYEQALADFERALGLDADYTWAIILRSEAYREMGRYEDALAGLNRALELESHNVWALVLRAESQRQMGRHETALADLDQAIALEPGNAWAIALRGETRRQMGQLETALTDLDRAVEEKPSYPWVLVLRGEAQRQMGRLEAALADLDRAVEADPKYAWALAHRGKLHWQAGRHEKALADLNQAITLRPDDLDWYYFGRALAYLAAELADRAQADLNAAIDRALQTYRQNPRDWRNTMNLALYFLVADQEEEATRYYREALSGEILPYQIRMAIWDLEDVMILFPNRPHLRAMHRMLVAEQQEARR